MVKNTKAKVKRTIQNIGSTIYDVEKDENGEQKLIERNVRDLLNVPKLEDFQTREDFNNWKEQQTKITSGRSPHFNFKKNEHGLAVTEHLLNVKENREYMAQREARKEQAKARENKEAEQRAGYMAYPTRIGFHKTGFNLDRMRSGGELERSMQRLIDQSTGQEYGRTKRRMMDNWLDSVAGSFENGEANDILDRFKQMSPEEWYDMYEQFYEDMTFRIYDSEGQLQSATDDNLDALRQYLDDYEWNLVNFDMKDF